MTAALLTLSLLLGATPEGAPVVPPRLVGQPPALEGTPARRGLVHTIVLELTITADGKATDIVVLEGPGEPWNSAAVNAATGARFQPATRGGEPIAVRLKWPLTVGTPTPWQGRGRRDIEPVPVVDRAVAGEILERGTRKPLAGITVLLDGTSEATISDAEGRFTFSGVPRGRYRLVVPEGDFDGLTQAVEVPALDVTLRLTPRDQARYRSIVRPPQTADAARIVVPVERAREVPGSSGDPLKVLESLPGVARPPAAGPNAGQISIRGSAPEDTKYYLDGMPLFQLFHFGSIYSVVQDEWIGAIDYRPGGFSVEYGDATGGFLGVTLSDIPDDGIHGHLDVNVYHAALLLTAPVAEDWTVGLAFRRSYIDAILGAIFAEEDGFAFTTAPRYYDYQFQAQYRPSETERLNLLWLGSNDKFAFVTEQPSDSNPQSNGVAVGRSFHQLQGTYRTQLSKGLGLDVGVATSYQTLEVEPARDRRFTLTFDPVTVRTALSWRALPQLSVRTGIDTTATRYKVEAAIPPPAKEGQVALPEGAVDPIVASEDGVSGELAWWLELAYRPLDDVGIIGGARLQGWMGTFGDFAVDPRLTVYWDVTESTRLSVAGGLNHQEPTADEWSRTFGNPELQAERAAYANLGVTQRVGDFLSIEVQGFYKHLDSLVSPRGFGAEVPYDNAGTGWIAGGELLVRWNWRFLDGWLSYTASRSVRRDRPDEPERLYSADQTHVLALVAGFELGDGWKAGFRFRYATGNPYTPLTAAYYAADEDVYVPTAAADPYSRRVEDFLQLDLRVDKTFIFDAWQLKLYLELNNTTNRQNVEQVGYTYDYSKRQDITGLPITPSLGIRAQW